MKKLLAVGVMVLFIGMTISSSTGLYVEKQSIKPLSSGNTLYVGGNGTGNYSSIQDAINDSSDGDTVFVYDDSAPYYESIVVNKTINLIGEDKDTTVIDGNESGDVVYVSADWVNISGFNIQDGGEYPRAGIAISSNFNTITGNNICSNEANGIFIKNSNNNNIYGNTISNNHRGIFLSRSYNNTINNNTITSNERWGIQLWLYSNDNKIIDNNVSENKEGIFIERSNKNSITYNKVYSNSVGIWELDSNNNNITYNIITDNSENGITLVGTYNKISGNTISSNGRIGIYLLGFCNFVSDNNIINNGWRGIELYETSNHIISRNTISKNDLGIWLRNSNSINIEGNVFINNGLYLYGSYNNSVANNTVNGKPLVYLENKTDTIINVDSGQVVLIKCDNITIKNQNISNTSAGILLYETHNCSIFGNNISYCFYGILIRYSSNNIIYHNNFINNDYNAGDEGRNTWDNGYPSGGNYWDDYTGNDSNGDGIGDTPYLIPSGDNEDRYPLMEPYGMGDENETFFGTLGPICPLLNIAEIKLIDGNESQIQKIEKILNNRILQFIIPLRWGFINVTELDFTITYNKEIPKIPFWLNFYYATILTENENDTFIDKPHTVTVKGLNGHFVISRGQPFRFRPPYFLFAGETYDEVTIELIERGRV